MKKKGSGKNRGRSHSPHSHCKIEEGVAEINNQLCNTMFGLVLSDQALRDFQSRRPSKISKTYSGDNKVAYLINIF